MTADERFAAAMASGGSPPPDAEDEIDARFRAALGSPARPAPPEDEFAAAGQRYWDSISPPASGTTSPVRVPSAESAASFPRTPEIRNAEEPGFFETMNQAFNPFAETTPSQKTDAQEKALFDYVLPIVPAALTRGAGGPAGMVAGGMGYAAGQALRDWIHGRTPGSGLNLSDAVRNTVMGSARGEFLGDAAKFAAAGLLAHGVRNMEQGADSPLEGYSGAQAVADAAPALIAPAAKVVMKTIEAGASALGKGPTRAIRDWAQPPADTELARGLGRSAPTDYELRLPEPADVTNIPGNPLWESGTGRLTQRDVLQPIAPEPPAPPTPLRQRLADQLQKEWEDVLGRPLTQEEGLRAQRLIDPTSDVPVTPPVEPPPDLVAPEESGLRKVGALWTTGNRRLAMQPEAEARAIGAETQYANDLTREWETNAQGIKGQILGKLSPEQLSQAHRLAEYEQTLHDAGTTPVLEALDGVRDPQTLGVRDAEAYGRLLSLKIPDADLDPAARVAVDQLRERLLGPFDGINEASGRMVGNLATGLRPYESRGKTFFPRLPLPAPEGVDRASWFNRGLSAASRGLRGGPTGTNPNVLEQARQARFWDPEMHSGDINDILDSYINETSRGAAMATAFGRPIGSANTGEYLAQQLGGLEAGGNLFARNVGQQIRDSFYNPQKGLKPEASGVVRTFLSNALLARAGIRNIPQVKNNPTISGYTNLVKGLARDYLGLEPTVRQFAYAGAADPGLAHFLRDVAPASGDTVGMRMLESVERGMNRSRGAAGYVPHLEDVGQRALAEIRAAAPNAADVAEAVLQGAKASPATTLEANFYGATPADLARETELYGRPDLPRRLGYAISNSQFHATPGEMPEVMTRDALGSILGMYRGFPVRQGNYLLDEIVKPMVSSDRDIRMMGRERLMRSLPGSLLLGGVSFPAISAMAGRGMMDPTQAASEIASDVGGSWGDLAVALAKLGPRAERVATPPIVSVGGDVAKQLGYALNDAWNGEFPLDPAAALSMKYVLPGLNLSGTGWEGMILPGVYNELHRNVFPRRQSR